MAVNINNGNLQFFWLLFNSSWIDAPDSGEKDGASFRHTSINKKFKISSAIIKKYHFWVQILKFIDGMVSGLCWRGIWEFSKICQLYVRRLIKNWLTSRYCYFSLIISITSMKEVWSWANLVSTFTIYVTLLLVPILSYSLWSVKSGPYLPNYNVLICFGYVVFLYCVMLYTSFKLISWYYTKLN